MTLNKPAGNMYPWAYTWNPMAGECPHQCRYCYVANKIAPWLKRMGNPKYFGAPRLVPREMKCSLVVPSGFIVFVQSCGDLFAENVLTSLIIRVLARVDEFPTTRFLFQTKNPSRFLAFHFPPNCILGTTIETNRLVPISKAPSPEERFQAMKRVITESMVSIEPIMDFDLPTLLAWMGVLKPKFVSVGADSGGYGFPEPTSTKLKQLLWQLELITEVRKKKNLTRLLKNCKEELNG